ncbi:MAG: dienelactone hydrolase family protein [bacterium]|jgi:carboxymethylenebutenolidase
MKRTGFRKSFLSFSHVLACLLTAVFLAGIVSTPVAQDFALQRLNDSPRHHEWVQIKQGDRIVHSFVVYPEVSEKALAVIVIHENRGLTDWVRSVADQLAEAGYIAIAPDLLSGTGPNGGKTSDFADTNAARDAIYQLSPEQVTADLNAVADYVKNLDACNGSIAVSGFCWGGMQSFNFATVRDDLSAAFVFYGSPPESAEAMERINAPVYGFYGGNDARINATIPKTGEQMKEAGKKYEPVIYEGAGHGFMRSGEEPGAEEANKKARDEAWDRWLKTLKEVENQ